MKRMLAIAIITTIYGGSAMAMEISSSSIENGVLQTQSACHKMGGSDVSPALHITDIPQDAAYLAIIMDDPDAQPVAGKTWVHWNVFNMPATQTDIKAGAEISGEVLPNSGGAREYHGMCPPNGRHTYRIAAFALNDKIDTSNLGEVTIESMEEDYATQILGKAQITGDWGG